MKTNSNQNSEEDQNIVPFTPFQNDDLVYDAQRLLSNDPNQSNQYLKNSYVSIDSEVDEFQKTLDLIGKTDQKDQNIKPFMKNLEKSNDGGLLNKMQSQIQQNLQSNSDKQSIKEQINKLQSILAEKLKAQLAEQELRKSEELLKKAGQQLSLTVDEKQQKEEDKKTFDVQQQAMELLNDLVKKQPNRQQLNSFLPNIHNQDEDAILNQPNLSYIKRKLQKQDLDIQDEEQQKIEEENRKVEEENSKWNELSEKDKWENLLKLNVKEQKIIPE